MPRILAVDDSPDQLLALELHLRGAGFDVETAPSGVVALQRCKEVEFDLILLDVRMPGIDGFEVSRRLNRDPLTAFTPILFLSGHLPSESARREASELGAVDFVQKPFDRDELLARIQLMLRLAGVRRRLVVENARLGRELDTALRSLEEARAGIADLRALWAADGTVRAGAVLLDEAWRVRGADARALELWPGLAIDEPLPGSGELAAQLAAAAASGGAIAIGVPGVESELRPLGGRFTALLLRDARAAGTVRERLRDREADSRAPVPASPTGYRITAYVGESPSVLRVSAMVDRLRRGRATVLVHGETGTGKEIVARALHFDGPQPSTPFVPIHCGAITRDLIESELFGFEKGAFTGAQQAHDGLFSAADGGTIFLDEIAETSLELQVKLLRVLQMGEIRPVGSTRYRVVDVRIVAATNRNLLQLVQQGRFREDLYHRLGVVTLQLPSLRERRDDLPHLLAHFLRVGNQRYERGDRPVRGVSHAAMRLLEAYEWPGNVRELENVVESAFALGCGELIQVENLPPAVQANERTFVLPTVESAAPLDLRARRERNERAAFEQALAAADGDKRAAAQALGLPRSTFYRRLRELGF